MPEDSIRAIVLDILDDVTVDALVTVRHAEEMADEIVAALGRRGLTIAPAGSVVFTERPVQ